MCLLTCVHRETRVYAHTLTWNLSPAYTKTQCNRTKANMHACNTHTCTPTVSILLKLRAVTFCLQGAHLSETLSFTDSECDSRFVLQSTHSYTRVQHKHSYTRCYKIKNIPKVFCLHSSVRYEIIYCIFWHRAIRSSKPNSLRCMSYCRYSCLLFYFLCGEPCNKISSCSTLVVNCWTIKSDWLIDCISLNNYCV